MERRRTEWVMHIWGKKRDTLELNEIEKFHIDVLNTLKDKQKEFDKILINIALDDINDMKLFKFLKKEISKVMDNENVEFKYCQNDRTMCEYVTFRPYVFDRIGEDVDIFYSHFKGYSTFFRIGKESFPFRVANMCEMFWSYIMYRYSLDNIKDAKDTLDGHSVYCWYILKNNIDNVNIGFYNEYQEAIQDDNEKFKGYIADDLHKHCPGGFMWYNLKRLGEVLEKKPEVKNISTEYVLEMSTKHSVNLCTHFSELYLMIYLEEDDCYSMKDYNKEVHNMTGTLYTGIYPSKKIAREYIPDFEKYLIDNELI